MLYLYFMIGVLLIIVFVLVLFYRNVQMYLRKAQNEACKYKQLFQMTCEWVNKEKVIINYIEKKGYKTIAVYGLGDVGKKVLSELEESSVKILYCIENGTGNCDSKYSVIRECDELSAVDAVIVTPIFYFDQIAKSLQQKGLKNIISIEDIIYRVK